MDFGLQNKTVLVTGGSKGIGKGVALASAREGARVAICARDEGPLEKTALEIKTLGAKVLAVPADVTDPGSAMRVIAETVRRFRGLDVLVNNAGGAQSQQVSGEPLRAGGNPGPLHLPGAGLDGFLGADHDEKGQGTEYLL